MLKIEEELNDEEQAEIFALKGRGLNSGAIASEMNKKYFCDISSDDVSKYLSKKKDKAVEALKKADKFEQKIAEQYFQSVTQMNELNQKLWAEFYSVKADPEYSEKTIVCGCGRKHTVKFKTAGEVVKIADHLLKQIQHVDRVVGRLKNTNLNVTYNITDMTDKIVKIMPNLLNRYERKGIIKIRSKKKLKEEKDN